MGIKNKILISCKTATELVVQKSDRRLSTTERFGLWLHFAYCGFCALFADQTKLVDEGAKLYSQKIQSEQKAYKLNPLKKAEINKSIQDQLKEDKA